MRQSLPATEDVPLTVIGVVRSAHSEPENTPIRRPSTAPGAGPSRSPSPTARAWPGCYNVFDASLPFGGYKQSGWGREMGHEVLNNYTEVKAVTTQL